MIFVRHTGQSRHKDAVGENATRFLRHALYACTYTRTHEQTNERTKTHARNCEEDAILDEHSSGSYRPIVTTIPQEDSIVNYLLNLNRLVQNRDILLQRSNIHFHTYTPHRGQKENKIVKRRK